MLVIFVMNIILQNVIAWFIYMVFSFIRIFKIMNECDVDINCATEFYKNEVLK